MKINNSLITISFICLQDFPIHSGKIITLIQIFRNARLMREENVFEK